MLWQKLSFWQGNIVQFHLYYLHSLEHYVLFILDYTDDDDIGSKRKKARTAFTSDQIFQLEKRFQAQKYLAANERGVIAEKLKLSDQQVIININ